MKRFISLLISAAMLAQAASCLAQRELIVFAETDSAVSMTTEEFGNAVSELAKDFEPNDYHEKITINEGDDFLTVDGEEISLESEGFDVINGVIVGSAEVFEKIEDAVLDSSGGNYILSAENDEILLNTDDGTAATENGQLELSAPVYESDGTVMLPVAEVARALGYEVIEESGSVELFNPFQSARLIVEAEGAIDIHGASRVIEGFGNLHILQYDTCAEAFAAYNDFCVTDTIEYVMPSRLYSVSAIEGMQEHISWGAETMNVDSFNAYLEDSGYTENEIVVAVVDTGADLDHPALDGRLIGCGVNFSSSGGGDAYDDNRHGTHVSGIICDLSLNNVKILPVKVLNSSGMGSDEQIFAGILYAINSGADVINLSLGGYGENHLYDLAVAEAQKNNVVICAAAGNDATDTNDFVPASVAGVITVSALDSDLSLAYYSNFGDAVDFAAPGSAIYSSIPGGGYTWLSGTSMASPHIAAAAAMIKSYDTSLSAEQVKDILISCSDDLGEEGRDNEYGYGLVNFAHINILTDKCKAPALSQAPGEYSEGFTMTLETETTGADIYYTLDGSVPSPANGTLYSAAINVSASTRLRAIAVLEGKYDSDEVTADYIINGKDIASCYVIENGVLVKYKGILKKITLESVPVTEIGDGAFKGSDISFVTLGFNIVKIGNNAFEDCKSLDSVVNSDGLVEIGDNCFSGCESLESISLDYISAIPNDAFSDCVSLETVHFSQATTIGDYSFSGCEALNSLGIDLTRLVSIGNGAFAGCENLTAEFMLPALQSIGEYAFYNCAALRKVSLPETIVSLPDYCFYHCESLSVLSARGLKALGVDSLAVNNNNHILYTDIIWSELTDIGEEALKGVRFEKSVCFSSLIYLDSFAFSQTAGPCISLPVSTEIPAYAFFYSEVELIHLPNAVSIAEYALDGCKRAAIGESCLSIADTSFDIGKIYAAANSYIATFAAQYDIAVSGSEFILEQSESQSVKRYEICELYVVAVAGTAEYQWYECDENGANALPVANSQTSAFCPQTNAFGEKFYFCEVISDAGTIRSSVIGVCVEQSGPATIPENEEVVTDESMSFIFTPQQSGEYYISFTGASLIEAKLFGSEYKIERSGEVLVLKANLSAGTDCIISTDCKEKVLYSAIASQISPFAKEPISSCIIQYSNEILLNDSAYPVPLITTAEKTLVEGVDYAVAYKDTRIAGITDFTVFGIGEYSGSVRCEYSIYSYTSTDVDYKVNIDRSDEYTQQLFVVSSEQKYYFYSRISADGFGDYVDNGGVDNIGAIADINGKILYLSTGCDVDDCFDYDYFYIEATLKKGTYYLITTTSRNSLFGEYSFRISTECPLMNNACVTISASEEYTGNPIVPDVTVEYNGSALVKDRDYAIIFTDNTEPGYAGVYILGLNEYFGLTYRRFLIYADHSGAQELSEGASVSADVSGGKTGAVNFSVSTAGTYLITFTASDEVISYLKNNATDIIYTNNTLSFTTSLSPSDYTLSFRTRNDYSDSVEVSLKRLVQITQTSLSAQNFDFSPTGTIAPSVVLSYNNRTLVEGTDYMIRYKDMNRLPGYHFFTVTGMGDFTGSASSYYEVNCTLSRSTSTLIGEGETTVNINTAGAAKIFRFVPSKSATYLLSTEELKNVALVVFNSNGAPVYQQTSPMGYYEELELRSNATYYIVALYYGANETGSWNFELNSNYSLLSDMKCEYDNIVEYNGGISIPEVSFTDDGYTLVEGEDYEYFYSMGSSAIGAASVCFRGLNGYKFETILDYTIILPKSVIFKEAQALELLTPLHFSTDNKYGDYAVYSYTAEKTGYYNFRQMNVFNRAVIQFYDENGNVLSIKRIAFDLSTRYFMLKGETIYMVAGYQEKLSPSQYYGFRVSVEGAGVDIAEYSFYNNGIYYSILLDFNLAYVASAEANITVADIEESVIGYPVTEIAPDAFSGCVNLQKVFIPSSVERIGARSFANLSIDKVFVPVGVTDINRLAFGGASVNCLYIVSNETKLHSSSVESGSTVYGRTISPAHTFCDENNISFVPLSSVLGDTNGDGVTNSTDAALIARYTVGLAELDKEALILCDVDGNGVVNAADAAIILRFTAGLITEYPTA